MLNRQPYLDGVFWSEGLNPKISGPFANQGDMNLAIIENFARQSQTNMFDYCKI